MMKLIDILYYMKGSWEDIESGASFDSNVHSL